jgi:Helix-turn-helix of DDE superfamily endonuclease
MRYDNLSILSEEHFRRLTGVRNSTFEKMVGILKTEKQTNRKYQGGRRASLSMEDSLLMTLEYLREYRTYFHIAKNYGVSESSAFKTIRFIEDTLIKHPDFALPGKKSLVKSGMEYELVLIDATESPIERPKKNRNTITQVKRKDIL